MAAAPHPSSDQTPCCAPVFESGFDEAAAIETAAMLKALADPVRLRLISIIGRSPDGEVCACDLPQLVDRSQPTVSHHLTQLVKAGLLRREQRGKWAWFSLDHGRLSALGNAITFTHVPNPPAKVGVIGR
jgi:ArsR family transcriptional regulator